MEMVTLLDVPPSAMDGKVNDVCENEMPEVIVDEPNVIEVGPAPR